MSVLFGPVTAVLGVRTTLVWAGLLGAAVTLAALFLPGMRDQERTAPLEVLIDGPAPVASETPAMAWEAVP